MTIVPPLTREQCQLIVDRYERRLGDALAARARFEDAKGAEPIHHEPDLHTAWLAGLESAALWAEAELAAAQMLALLGAHWHSGKIGTIAGITEASLSSRAV